MTQCPNPTQHPKILRFAWAEHVFEVLSIEFTHSDEKSNLDFFDVTNQSGFLNNAIFKTIIEEQSVSCTAQS